VAVKDAALALEASILATAVPRYVYASDDELIITDAKNRSCKRRVCIDLLH
jgi:hypothetical protein